MYSFIKREDKAQSTMYSFQGIDTYFKGTDFRILTLKKQIQNISFSDISFEAILVRSVCILKVVLTLWADEFSWMTNNCISEYICFAYQVLCY